MSRPVKVLLVGIVIVVVVVVLFTTVFPWVEEQLEDPTMGQGPTNTPADMLDA